MKKYNTDTCHWYMAAVEIQYVVPSPTNEKQNMVCVQKVNVLITPIRKNVTAKDVDDVRNLSLLRLRDQYKVDPERVSNLVILDLMYLGLMSEADYFREHKGNQDGQANPYQ